MILKKKEIIAASLVLLIGMAGYLNWSYQDTVHVEDNESYVETGKILGEAEMVSSNNEVTEEETELPSETEAVETGALATDPETNSETDPETDVGGTYFAEARMKRENARAAAMESLKESSEDESLDEDTRRMARERLIECAENIETESQIENIAAARGFSDVCVYINNDSVTMTVKTEGLSPEDVEKLTDAIVSNTDVSADNVTIIEVKQ